jgi:acyl-CoA oxidase
LQQEIYVLSVLLCNCFREPEPQILDYRTQQYKLFPYLAASFAVKFTAIWLWNMYNEVISELEGGDLERLPEVGLFSSQCTHSV